MWERIVTEKTGGAGFGAIAKAISFPDLAGERRRPESRDLGEGRVSCWWLLGDARVIPGDAGGVAWVTPGVMSQPSHRPLGANDGPLTFDLLRSDCCLQQLTTCTPDTSFSRKLSTTRTLVDAPDKD
jgi:hypothetical protein